MECLFLDYVKLLMIGQVIQVTKVNQNATKISTSDQLSDSSDESQPKCKTGPLSLDFIHILMIGQVIQVIKVDQNGKKAP